MPIIAFANSKGGSGKTTSALLLACELAESKPVTVIDADPRRPISDWAAPAKEGKTKTAPPKNLTVIRSEGENTILDEIDEAASRDPFVIIDLEGVASKLVSRAIGQADFVIIPLKEQQQDANAALDIILEVHREMKAVRRKIPYAALFTATKYIKSRTARHIATQFRANERIDTFDVEIAERDAYSAIFSTGGSVRALDPAKVNNLDKAVENVEGFMAEVIAKVRALREGGERQVA